MCVCVCVCVVCVANPFVLDVRFVGVPAGVTQKEDHRGFLHLPSVMFALVFLAREIFSRSFSSSNVKSNFVFRVFFSFFMSKNPTSCGCIEI